MSRTDTLLFYSGDEIQIPDPKALIGFYAVKRGKGRFEVALQIHHEFGSWFLYENGSLIHGPCDSYFLMMQNYDGAANDMGIVQGRQITKEEYKALAAARIRDALNGHEGKRDLMNVQPPTFERK